MASSQDSEEPLATAACENCRTRKVRCDRQTPQCSNCEKAGVPCEFPNRGKRINHVKQLVEDVSSLGSRLDSIDETIGALFQHMSTLQTASFAASNSSRASAIGMPETPSNSDLEDMESIFYASPGAIRSGNNVTVAGSSHIGTGPGLSLGHIGARSLFENSRQSLATLLEGFKYASTRDFDTCKGEKEGLRASPRASLLESELRAKYDQYPIAQGAYSPSVPTNEGQAVASPPQSLLETCLPVFLEYFNSTLPIFNESRLNEVIKAYYTDRASRANELYNLCFNNIIVLALGLQSRVARMDQVLPKGMSDELLPAFLNNSFRAFQHLSTYLHPGLVCCQALATLALVAREYHESRVFDTVCHMASQAVKSMGLQQCNLAGGNKNSILDIEENERRNLYWAVFVIDKQRTYIAGRPFDLHFYDSDVQLFQSIATQTVTQQCWKAYIHMMAIWEEIYIYLYSLRAFRKGLSYRQSQISKLDCLSRKWYAHNAALLSNACPVEISAVEGWQIELKYAFHIGQVLIHRFSSEECSRQVALANSRATLRIIQMSIHGLFTSFLANPIPEALDDLGLIDSVAEALDAICNPNTPTACILRVNEGVQWYREVAKIFQKYFEGLRPQSPESTQTQPPKRSHETSPLVSQAHPGSAPSESSVQKRRKTPQSLEDAGQLPQPETSALSSWVVPEMEDSMTFDSLQAAPVMANGCFLHRLPPVEDNSNRSSGRGSSSGILPPTTTATLRLSDKLAQFLQDNASPLSAGLPQSQPITSPSMGDRIAPTASIPPSSLGLFSDTTPQVTDDGPDGGIFPFFLGQSDLSDSWGEMRDRTVPDEFFLHA
ncbi:uncharacterized protein ATNIH1004_002230 [Aspergillus tanneri]|nr:uncharacterized protein ATNIH1004_002230 [Aspergillus tanneri]KAA8649559.1 hypothetical protein ATNIH1004_002230 [Aspergillus tanneri]